MTLTSAAKSDLLLLVVTFMAAISWMFSREAVSLMPPVLFIAVRFMLAGLLLGAIGFHHIRHLNRGQCLRIFRLGLVFGVAMSCWVSGLKRIEHVGEGAFLTSLAAVLVPVVARLMFREAQPLSTWIALPVAVLGLALLSLENGFRPEPAQLFFVTAATLFALYFNLNTQAANVQLVTGSDGVERQEQIPALILTALTLIMVGLVAGTVSWVAEPWQPTFYHLTPGLVGWVLAATLVGTAGRFLVQTYAQSLSTHSHGVVILVLEPVWVAGIAALWFAETMAPSQIAGCALIFAALLINRAGALRRLIWR